MPALELINTPIKTCAKSRFGHLGRNYLFRRDTTSVPIKTKKWYPRIPFSPFPGSKSRSGIFWLRKPKYGEVVSHRLATLNPLTARDARLRTEEANRQQPPPAGPSSQQGRIFPIFFSENGCLAKFNCRLSHQNRQENANASRTDDLHFNEY
jgi:hypothetical protein